MELGNLSPGLILATVVGLALIPYIAVMVTSFTKLVVVFSLLRNALGLQQTPPNMVLNGLAIILSIYVMYPVGLKMSAIAKEQGLGGKMELSSLMNAVDQAKEPLRDFMIRHTADAERRFFLKTAQRLLEEQDRALLSDRDLIVVVPAFTVSELTAAFQIGFLIFLPFLIIDLVVSNILQAMGMMMLSPTTISMPFKLLLVVVLDGWSKIVHGLVLTYR
ncbi:type III secretion system export apparatus subunit SctR [Chitinivorax sp. PXF-14]|uniref:type III secretion system export apparatus subunit SctR n=1 Tax=Chitinivorax sp. PXF-14 TaxID=3230488 RepID=UPI003465DDA6